MAILLLLQHREQVTGGAVPGAGRGGGVVARHGPATVGVEPGRLASSTDGRIEVVIRGNDEYILAGKRSSARR
ncbi:hypothetical protein ACQP2P_21080 [Dactylosporangium sp. CA-139114]|uniref:hypothetical protein n=1 Tax=Dactylosporangium sp. CA-139114 TaxID=3239931 RepID=UPI003D99946F